MIGKISFLLRKIALHLTLLLTELNAGYLALYSAPTRQKDFDIYRREKHLLLPAVWRCDKVHIYYDFVTEGYKNAKCYIKK